MHDRLEDTSQQKPPPSPAAPPAKGKRRVPLELLTPTEAIWQACVVGLFAMACLLTAAWSLPVYGTWLVLVAVVLAGVYIAAAAPSALKLFRAEALRNLRLAVAEGDEPSIRNAILCAQALGVSAEEAAGLEELRAALQDKMRGAVRSGDACRARAAARCARAAGVRRSRAEALQADLSACHAAQTADPIREPVEATSSSSSTSTQPAAFVQSADGDGRGGRAQREAGAPGEATSAAGPPEGMADEAKRLGEPPIPQEARGTVAEPCAEDRPRADLDPLDQEISRNWIML